MIFYKKSEPFKKKMEPIYFNKNKVYLLNDLITFDRPYFVGCIRKPRDVIQKKGIPEDSYCFATYSKKYNKWSLSNSNVDKARILIKEEWVHNNLPKFTGNDYKYKPLPNILKLEDHEKFRDVEGNVHEVEVRGEKTKDGIRFKCKDIARIFEMDSLKTHVNRMLEKSEYEIFFCSSEKGGNPFSIYLLPGGLYKIIFSSRSGVAHKFQNWAVNILTTAHIGTPDERINVAADIIGTNADLVRKVLKTCIAEIPCIYLFEVGKLTEMAKLYPQLKQKDMRGSIYKYGRTNNLYRRTKEHIDTYDVMKNTRLKLKLFSPVDTIHCVKAENMIREQFKEHHINFKVEDHNFTELIVINRDEMSNVKNFYKTIYTKFSQPIIINED